MFTRKVVSELVRKCVRVKILQPSEGIASVGFSTTHLSYECCSDRTGVILESRDEVGDVAVQQPADRVGVVHVAKAIQDSVSV